jgi:two-component system NtrC family sensor kinase
MHPYLLFELVASIAAAMLASAIFVRDPNHPVNRRVASILLCVAHWSACELLWGLSDDPATARRLIQASSLGWGWLGALCFDVLLKITGGGTRRLRRLLPLAYASAAVGIALYVATPWCAGTPVRVAWGWSPTFGPLFPVALVPAFGWSALGLVTLRRHFPGSASPLERREARWLFLGIALPIALTAATDVLLPYAGVYVPRPGGASCLFLGAVVARSISRYGSYLLAPGAFTNRILEALRDGVALVRADGTIHAGNQALAALRASPLEALPGLRLASLLPDLDQAENDVVSDRPMELVRADGSRIPVSCSYTLLHDDAGAAIGRAVAVRDERDVEALKGHLVTADRLAVVGEISAGIAHEISTPICYVRANLGLLREHWTNLAAAAQKASPEVGLEVIAREGEELLEESLEGVERVASVVRDIRSFAHAGLADSELVDLNQLVANTVNVAILGFPVTVEQWYSELPPVRCAPQQIKQVFLNLLLNALQATDGRGRIQLRTRMRDGSASVRIEDDGCGISPEMLERIFDPFFTTRPGEGTGLGLALCYQIVRRHRGEILVESAPGRGSRFEVLLPVATE